MYRLLKKTHTPHLTPLYFYTNLIDHCFAFKCLNFVRITHARLIKVGFNRHTFLGNRCIDLYSHVGLVDDVLKVFDDIPVKNCISLNICLMGLFRFGQVESAVKMFDEMPERDVVSWNSMISGYLSCGFVDRGLRVFAEMQNVGVGASEYTYSIMLSEVWRVWHGKEIHGNMIRHCLCLSNVVLGNSLVDMYGKLGRVDYAFGVFLTMKELDTITWNSLIWGCYASGSGELALNKFFLMRSEGYLPDHFTLSSIITICSNMRNLEKGKQILAMSIELGHIANPIVSSAAIDLFSKCNRLDYSARLFRTINRSDSATCNAMISSYSKNGCHEDALRLFMLTLQEGLKPTEFTLSSILSSVSTLLPMEQGSQIHSLVMKSGFESDPIISSSLVQMYAKYGLIDSALSIFEKMGVRDLISWNTMIFGLARNGRVCETLNIFKELLAHQGQRPDRITIAGVLLACNDGGLVDDGIRIFQSMEIEYGVVPGNEHYAHIIDLMSQAGIVEEAIDMIQIVPRKADPIIWSSILCACYVNGDLNLIELVAAEMINMEPKLSLPYQVLARAYEMRGEWESVVRVKQAMKDTGIRDVIGCSEIGIRDHIYAFVGNQLLHNRSEEMCLILDLIMFEMEDEGIQYQNIDEVGR